MPSECLGQSLTPAVLCSGRQLSYLCCCPICTPLPLPRTPLPHEEKTPPAPPEASSPLAEWQPHPSGQTPSWELSSTPLSHPTPNPSTGRQLHLQPPDSSQVSHRPPLVWRLPAPPDGWQTAWPRCSCPYAPCSGRAVLLAPSCTVPFLCSNHSGSSSPHS